MNTDTPTDFTVSGTQTTAVHPPNAPHPNAPHPNAPRPNACAEEPCDLVTVPARQGLEAVDIIRRGAAPAAVGPVLHDGACDTLGFLVPPGTAAAWDVPGSACTETNGRGLRMAGLPVEPPVTGSGWLLPPDTTEVTDPGLLRAALGEAARMIEAADGICEAGVRIAPVREGGPRAAGR
ncbi:hypothetical protein [Streptomyces sp. NBC_00083]|uniref:hypothetical protein n=1 Tax=Streptomyces sp. NBC_00083 TaxID=2975647 RepID=UPI0022540A24|nr:hypothetical protein [Streptomyces sp. NBC_00083]MCX5382277.1 hypothetical protein [Streptomyces sp. NBC_00083]